jgi:hypothetical protein
MTPLQLIAGLTIAAVSLVLALVFGIRHWKDARGKIIAVGSGLALVSLVAGVGLLIVAAAVLPAVISLP